MRGLDLRGRRFGRLIALKCYSTLRGSAKAVLWSCICDCGKSHEVRTDSLRNGVTISCGCRRKETLAYGKLALVTHGDSAGGKVSSLLNTWYNIVQRCENPNNPNYKNYGGRGIAMCEEWQDYAVFKKWAIDNGHGTPGLTVDRINNNLGYSPGNCRMSTRIQQANNKRNNRKIILNGVEETVPNAARAMGLKPATLRARIIRNHLTSITT